MSSRDTWRVLKVQFGGLLNECCERLRALAGRGPVRGYVEFKIMSDDPSELDTIRGAVTKSILALQNGIGTLSDKAKKALEVVAARTITTGDLEGVQFRVNFPKKTDREVDGEIIGRVDYTIPPNHQLIANSSEFQTMLAKRMEVDLTVPVVVQDCIYSICRERELLCEILLPEERGRRH